MSKQFVWALCLVFVTGSAFAGRIHGTVKDTSGQPLGNVTIGIDQSIVTETDANGRYSASVPDGPHQVTFKRINFATMRRTVDVHDIAAINVALPLETSAS